MSCEKERSSLSIREGIGNLRVSHVSESLNLLLNDSENGGDNGETEDNQNG